MPNIGKRTIYKEGMIECVLNCTFNISKETGLELDNKHWYENIPKSVEMDQEGKAIILWNQQVRTDKSIPNHKPDIIIHDNKQGMCMLIEAAIPGDRNVITTKASKILK